MNGTPGLPKAVRRRIGFVTQDDLMWQALTVHQTLMYAAELRLPEALSRAEKRERVERIIALLGLEKCRATPIGGAFQRGVSGGERKRTSIAVELLTVRASHAACVHCTYSDARAPSGPRAAAAG